MWKIVNIVLKMQAMTLKDGFLPKTFTQVAASYV